MGMANNAVSEKKYSGLSVPMRLLDAQNPNKTPINAPAAVNELTADLSMRLYTSIEPGRAAAERVTITHERGREAVSAFIEFLGACLATGQRKQHEIAQHTVEHAATEGCGSKKQKRHSLLFILEAG